MGNSACNAELQTLFRTRNTSKKGTLFIVRERASQRITHLVAESSYAGHLRNVGLHSPFFFRIGARTGTPSFPIDKNIRIDFVQLGTNIVHCFYIMNAHQIETEAVNMVFSSPVFNAFKHILTHHRTLRCRFIATA